LIWLRTDHAVLRRGSIDTPSVIDQHVIMLLQCSCDQWALVAVNNAAQSRTLAVTLPAGPQPNVLRDVMGRADRHQRASSVRSARRF
jgi:uncharacterized protein